MISLFLVLHLMRVLLILSTVLKRCKEINLVLSWEKSHFMVQEGTVLGYKVSKKGIEIDKAKIDLISNLYVPSSVKQVRSFFDYVGFYRGFTKDFSKVIWPLTNLLTKDTLFVFDESYEKASEKLRSLLVSASIVCPPNFSLPFDIMCDVYDFASWAGFIYYARRTLTDA